MAIGFDYGTANCSVAYFAEQQLQLVPLQDAQQGEELYLPSTLSASTPESVTEYLFRCLDIKPNSDIGEQLLRRAIRENREQGLVITADDVKYGREALSIYLDDPKDVYYVKSPKSFLGVIGLRDAQLAFFEDLVCAMMSNIKQRTEQHLQASVEQSVIGRPVNFLGRGGDKSNQQAEGILYRAAKRAGFKQIEFQYEPIAAGLDFETQLTTDKKVLVVDIGGGTTDCSFLMMGPSYRHQTDRRDSLLGHTGQRIGGNDFDIYLAFKRFMHEFGLGSQTTSGLPIPTVQFWNAIAINDVQAQRAFYAHDNLAQLKAWYKQATEPEKLVRFIQLHQQTLGYAINREAEQAKIALSDHRLYQANLDLGQELLSIPISVEEMLIACETPIEKIKRLVEDAVAQAGVMPDVIYMTGGSARSSILRDAVKQVLPHTPIEGGNYFGSVTAGLARWADLLYR